MPASPASPYLTEEQRKYFAENGFLLLENFLDSNRCDQLRNECHRIVDGFDLEEHKTVFVGDNQRGKDTDRNYASQQYFLDSWNKTAFFFEKDAFDGEGNLTAPRHESINKIGHYLHVNSQPFRDVTFDKRIQSIGKELLMQQPRICQSMYIFKQPRIGGIVDAHQDASFLWTEPQCRLLGFWIALEDATMENGCLWFVPGSHKDGLVDGRRLVRKVADDGCVNMQFVGDDPNKAVPFESYVPVPVKKGTLVLIDGFVLHMSKENRSNKSREIYTWHAIDLPDDVSWSELNWMQPDDVRQGFELLCK